MSIEKDVRNVSDMVNNMSFNPEEFCKKFRYEHRTLQQSFTRLCINWLCTCASDDYGYDDRNRASHEVAKALLDSQDADFIGYIPYI